MKYLYLATLLAVLAPAVIRADSLWERRNPYTAYLFQDTRARKVGDVLTVAVREATLFDGKENRELKKEVAKSKALSLKGSISSSNAPSYDFAGEFAGS